MQYSTGHITHLSSISCVRLVTAGGSTETPVSFSTCITTAAAAVHRQRQTAISKHSDRWLCCTEVRAMFECTCSTMSLAFQLCHTPCWAPPVAAQVRPPEAVRSALHAVCSAPASHTLTTFIKLHPARLALTLSPFIMLNAPESFSVAAALKYTGCAPAPPVATDAPGAGRA